MIEVTGVDGLISVIRTFRDADDNVQEQMRVKAAEEADAEWVPSLRARAITTMEQAVIASDAGVDMTENTLTLYAARSTQPLSGGLVPDSEWGGVEFGARVKQVVVERAGKRRRQIINRQFQPFTREGYVAWPNARRVAPQVVAAWINGAVKGLTMGNEHMETS